MEGIVITIMSGCVGCSVRMYVQESSNMNGLLGSVAMASTEIFCRSGLVTSRAQGLRCNDGFNLLVAWALCECAPNRVTCALVSTFQALHQI